jgi:hypothetical protein
MIIEFKGKVIPRYRNMRKVIALILVGVIYDCSDKLEISAFIDTPSQGY